MARPHHIALGSIFTESNHLGGKLTDLEAFRRTELRYDADVLAAKSGYVAGMLDVLREQKADIAPLLVANACPGGPITAECYGQLKSEMLQRLKKAMPVDGVALPLHGAAAAEGVDDLDGDVLEAVREIVGEKTPVVASLDLHAHLTEAMMRNADALVALETYPHRDAHTTGQRAARMLCGILDGKIKPTMAMAKVPVLVSGIHGSTEGDDPFADLMRFTKSHEGKNRVLSTSLILVDPYLDAPGMASGGIIITDDDMDKAVSLSREIAIRYWNRRHDFEPEIYSPKDAISEGVKIKGGPVLLVETADCCGGGAAGDSVATLRALLEANLLESSLVPVVDPEATTACHKAGVGSTVTLSLGHKLDPKWGSPIKVTGKVLRLRDGRFRYSGGMWKGVEANMGASAVFQLGSVQVLIASEATYDWADEQFRSMEMDARTAKFVVVKNPMNYRQGYADVAKAVFVLDTPGPTPPTLRHVKFKKVQRPYYPADQDIPDLQPVILRGRMLP